MRRNTLWVAFVLGLVLVGSVFAASSKQSSNAASTQKISGTIVSSSSSELILSSVVKGKTEQDTFVVNAQTKTHGTLAAGDNAIVRYKNENGQKVATMISVQRTKTTKGK